MNKLTQLRKSRSIDEPLTFLPWAGVDDDDNTTTTCTSFLVQHQVDHPSTPSSPSSSSSISYLIDSLLDYYRLSNNTSSPTPSPIPSITLSSSSFNPQPSSLTPSHPIFIPTVSQENMPSASSLPQKFNHLYSRFKPSKSHTSRTQNTSNSSINSPPPNSSSSTFIRPSPVKVPPSSVGLDVDPSSWVQSDDSEDESDDETLVKNVTAPTSLGDDEVPLSRLRKHSSGGLLSPVTPTSFNSPTSETHFHPRALSRHRPSLSLHSLYKKPEIPTASPQLPSQLPSQNYSAHGGHVTSSYVFPRVLQPPMPIRPLRPAMSSPNLSRERVHSQPTSFNPPSFPAPPPPPSQASSIGFTAHRFTPTHGNHKFPSQHSQLGTPPSLMSPPAWSHKLSSPQSSVSFRSTDKDVYRRMKQRHKEDLHHLHSKYPGPSPCVNIDPSLYSMLSDAQRSALRQRSDILGQNLKMHLESFAQEMIQHNMRQQCFNGVGA